MQARAQVLTAITAWCQHNDGADAFPELFGAVRLQHLAPHELHACLQHGMLAAFPAALAHVHAALADPESAADEDTRRTAAPSPAKAARRLETSEYLSSPPLASMRSAMHALLVVEVADAGVRGVDVLHGMLCMYWACVAGEGRGDCPSLAQGCHVRRCMVACRTLREAGTPDSAQGRARAGRAQDNDPGPAEEASALRFLCMQTL